MAETFNSAMRVVRRSGSVPVATTEVATVWRVGRIRYFTKRAACEAMARAWVKQRCDCEPDDISTGYVGGPCKYHDPMRYPSLLRRLSRLAANELRGVR